MTHLNGIPVGIFVVSATVGCSAPLPPPTEPWQSVAAVPPERPICGWEEVDAQSKPIKITELGGATAMPGDRQVVIEPQPAVRYATVQQALKPADASLVRVKLAFDGRWLLTTTYPQKLRQPPKPPPSQRSTRIVGHRKVTRDVRRPAERFAALRVNGDRVTLFVENERQDGEVLPISELKRALLAIEPRTQVFALTATADTEWASVQTVAATAACYDREPGDEPHEVILD